MLYELQLDNQGSELKPLDPMSVADLGKKEKDLENLMATHLLETLFETNTCIPFHQERNRQEEADIYAINEDGDIVLFELKRAGAGRGALEQVLCYAQKAGEWNYDRLNEMFKNYVASNGNGLSGASEELDKAHQEAFMLSNCLSREQFNHAQHMIIVGNAADSELIKAVDYWKQKGMNIDFTPYRIYKIGEKLYFDFFAKPYDEHAASGVAKGVLWDTNFSNDEEAVWAMMGENKVAAWRGKKEEVLKLSKGDTVFFYHKGWGIIAAAEVTAKKHKENTDDEEYFFPVKFLTPKPEGKKIKKHMDIDGIREATGKNFFWARTIKVPYLTKAESDDLLKKVNAVLR